MLWIPISIEDKIKMFINQRNSHESYLMQMLIYVQYKSQNKLLKQRDNYLIRTLDNAVYEKYTQLCDQEAMQIQLKSFKYLRWMNDEETIKQMEFLTYLQDKFQLTKSNYLLLYLDNYKRMDKLFPNRKC